MRYLLLTVVAMALAGLSFGGCYSFVATDVVDPPFETTAGAKLVVLGDINNDGLTDVVSVSGESQPVQVHLHDPLTLSFETYTIAGGAPLSKANDVELADLNGDGRLDIIVLVQDTGFIPPEGAALRGAVVILVQGDDPRDPAKWTQIPKAGVIPPDNLSFGTSDVGATDLAVGDMDGRNGPDIVVLVNEPDNKNVFLFENPGTARVTDQTAWSPQIIEQDAADLGRVELADLDIDGDLDVVMSVPTGKSFNLRWLQNPLIEEATSEPDPVPTFVPSSIDPLFEATAGARADVLGDVDGDGLTDIVSISEESQPVQLHLRDALTGMFDTISIAGGAPLGRSIDLELADFNDDGKLDIAVLVNNTSYTPPPGVNRRGALVLLLQGDDARNPSDWTQVDVIRQKDPSIDCLVNDPGGACDMLFDNDAVGVQDLAVGDFNADGFPDIVLTSNEPQVSNAPTKFLYLFTNPGLLDVDDPAEWRRTILDQAAITNMAKVHVVDLDEDGDDDVLLSVPDAISFNLRWLRNPHIGANTIWTRELVGQQDGGGDFMAVGDIDGDGHLDVAASSDATPLTQWFRNPGPAALAVTAQQVPWAVFTIGRLGGGLINQLQLVDLDSDGTLDCFITASGYGVGFRRQDDVEHVWDEFTIFISDPPANVGTVAFGDFDGDGRLDIIAPFNREGLLEDEFVMYNSVAASLWHRRLIGQQQNGGEFIALGDVDRDGRIDVAAASEQLGVAQWFRNPGPTALLPTAPQVPWNVFTIGEISAIELGGSAATGEVNQLQLADLNGDGKLDAFVTASGIAFEFIQFIDPQQSWLGAGIFQTDPPGTIGRVGFLGTGIVIPVDREGLSKDAIILFER